MTVLSEAIGAVTARQSLDLLSRDPETDVIVLISNCPQLNNPCNGYNPTPIEVLVWEQ